MKVRIIVINLERAIERRTAMRERLAGLGLPFELLPATDGRALTAAELAMVDDTRRKRHARRPLTRNEIACFVSHRRAMAALVAGGEPMAAILEDDVTLSPELPRALRAIEAEGGRFDVIDLFHSGKRSEFFVPCRPLLPDLALGRIGYAHMGANAYVVSRAGAERFLAQTGRFADEVDRELHRYWANGLDVYGLERPVAFHRDGGVSMIDETRGRAEDYPDADTLRFGLHRACHRAYDGVRKRLSFPAYVRRGKLARVEAVSTGHETSGR